MEAIEIVHLSSDDEGEDDIEAVCSANEIETKKRLLTKHKSHSSSQISEENIVSSGLSSCRSVTCASELGFLSVDDISLSSPQPISAAPLCRKFWKAGNYDNRLGSKVSSQYAKNYLHVHPLFLHSNATSHKWVFGAIAELLDNAVDEIHNGATFVKVDKIVNPKDGSPALLIQDDGSGMGPEAMQRCMSFGFSDKISEFAIGQYGNGFKTGSMRLGADAIVFSCHVNDMVCTKSIGLLSYTLSMRAQLDRIVVPMVNYKCTTSTGYLEKLNHQEHFKSNMSLLLDWSPFLSEAEIVKQFDDIENHHGTKIIIFNLWFNDDENLELDFDTDPQDILIAGDVKKIDTIPARKRVNEQHLANRLHYSLRDYLSILYLWDRVPNSFRIILRGQVVKFRNIADDLTDHAFVKYRPHNGGLEEAIFVTIGFLKEAPEVDIHGFNVYHKNRLILIHMDGHDSIMGSDTEAHSGSTPQPPVSNNANMGPPKRKSRSNRSACWDHFTPMPRVEGVKAANCNYCKTRIQYSGGTSAMRAHLRRCNLYPPNMMMHESASSSLGNREVVVNSSPAVPKFDQEVSRIDLVNMFVALELPFQKVEHPYFRKFVYGLQPKFMLPSRITLAREILKNWDMEKAKLKSFLSQHCRRVCLTTDTWTSTQNFNYMCLTAHFIDNNWKLQKKVLNFMQVTEYTGEIMAKTVKECLNGWELGRVLSVTVDNASSNDVGIRHLKRWLLSQNGLVSNGEHLHTRCCAHILNLIVKDGLTIVNESILRIRSAVRYVRRTPSRFQRFKKCIDRETISFKGYVGLDCETRWNATYTMMNSAFKHMKTFIELEFTDQQYVNEMRKDKGVPTLKDWEEVGSILPFLKIFHDATVRVSGSSYLTSNLYMLEVFSVGQKIAKMCCSEDASLKSMALKMRAKYNKYWGDPESLNMFLLIAMVLDPRRKLKLVDWMARRIYSSAEAESLTTKIQSCLKSIYEEYSGGGVSRLGNYGNVAGVLNEAEDPYELCDFYESDECNTSATELQKYLINENVEEDRPDFDLLEWWKINSSRLPILASIARDVLAIPISTVASESTFSTGGRVLDPYRSSLTPRTVEALICTQDWLDAPFTCFLSSEDLDVIEKIEEDLLSTQDAPSCSASTSITLDDD